MIFGLKKNWAQKFRLEKILGPYPEASKLFLGLWIRHETKTGKKFSGVLLFCRNGPAFPEAYGIAHVPARVRAQNPLFARQSARIQK
ncbi:MAG: hypothetical protein WC342_04110 [Methanoregula sp.]|jgi:hypothetical protein